MHTNTNTTTNNSYLCYRYCCCYRDHHWPAPASRPMIIMASNIIQAIIASIYNNRYIYIYIYVIPYDNNVLQ